MEPKNNPISNISEILSSDGESKESWNDLLCNIISGNQKTIQESVFFLKQKLITKEKVDLILDITDFLINFGSQEIIEQIASKDFLNTILSLLKNKSKSGVNIQKKIIFLTQKWHQKFEKDENQNVKGFSDNYNLLKKGGIIFPPQNYQIQTYNNYISEEEAQNSLMKAKAIKKLTKESEDFKKSLNYANPFSNGSEDFSSNQENNIFLDENTTTVVNNNNNIKMTNNPEDINEENEKEMNNEENEKENNNEINEKEKETEKEEIDDENPYKQNNDNENNNNNNDEKESFSLFENNNLNQNDNINNNIQKNDVVENNNNNNINQMSNIVQKSNQQSNYPSYPSQMKNLNNNNFNNNNNNQFSKSHYVNNTPKNNVNNNYYQYSKYNNQQNNNNNNNNNQKFKSNNPNFNMNNNNRNNNNINRNNNNYNNSGYNNNNNNRGEQNDYLMEAKYYKRTLGNKLLQLNAWINEGKFSFNSGRLKNGIQEILGELAYTNTLMQRYQKIGQRQAYDIIRNMRLDIEQTCARYEALNCGKIVEPFYSSFQGNTKQYYYNINNMFGLDQNYDYYNFDNYYKRSGNSNAFNSGFQNQNNFGYQNQSNYFYQNNQVEKEKTFGDKLSDFGSDVKDGFIKFGRTIKNGAVSGYKFIKKKISDDDDNDNDNNNN